MIAGIMQAMQTIGSLGKRPREGRDYAIDLLRGTSDVAIMAPHGGGIEPGTDSIAKAIAGQNHSYYAFKGIRPRGNRRLHRTSHRFDEPQATALLKSVQTVVTLHGCREKTAVLFVGGLDTALGERIAATLSRHPFDAHTVTAGALRGIHPENLCNRGRRRCGVQLEMSFGLRQQLLGDRFMAHPAASDLFRPFIFLVRQALNNACRRPPAEPCENDPCC
jgi:phage replication-related protein YjqB (UPF0714/DUF867 family)